MREKHHHILNVIDFTVTEHRTTFVKVAGYDAVLEKEFEGEVKILNGTPYGDLIHSQRSSLSPECRQFVQENLLNKYNEGKFE
jgi:hypothetical protein